MSPTAAWISAREAAERLDVKLATLYAYASRGLIESVPALDGRGRRYASSAVERLRTRHDARAGHGAVAAGALRWGEPTLETSISEIRSDGPYYRGHSAIALADGRTTFEAVCDLLWTGAPGQTGWPAYAPRKLQRSLSGRVRSEPSSIAHLAAAVSCAALSDPERHGASEPADHERARQLLGFLSGQLPGHATAPGTRALHARNASMSVAERVLVGLGGRSSSRAIELVDRALILCADHELNASTFAARVTASTGADLYACLGSALHALSGPRHGNASARVEALLREIARPADAARVLRERRMRGEDIPGCGHPLYPAGDPRASVLLALSRIAVALPGPRKKQRSDALARVDALRVGLLRAEFPAPNLDLGLVVLCDTLALPPGSASLLFALGRVAGWVAHALEQRRQGYLLRPRARYVAPDA